MRALRRLLLLLVLLPGLAAAGADPAYLSELQAQARAQNLAAQTGWLRLLHHNPRVLARGREGTFDFPGFYLAADGKHDSQAELDATLAAFFDPAPLYDEPRQCRFHARYEWLRAQLHFDPARLPPSACTRLDEWLAALDTGALTLVFASNDLDSPSSMFGHTLLRLDSSGAAGDQRLLGYAVNYAAQTTREAGMLYAIKGLTGFYQGHFSVMPYYDKVREYERFEHRDLWEYPLLLDDATRQRLLWHLWELRGVGSDYYFFGENCSYQLLGLVEAAAPELELTAPFRSGPDYTIPVDSVRALRAAGVLGAPTYRPANANRLLHRYADLSEREQGWVQDYVAERAGLDDSRYANATPESQARLLEVTHDALYFRFQKGAGDKAASLPRARELLAARAKLDAQPEFAPVPPPAASPDRGHGSGRVSAGTRAMSDHTRTLLSWRPAYHDRLDPPQGYLAGGELEFLNLEASLDDDGLELDHARVLNVQAIAPRSALLRPVSWFATLDAARLRALDEDRGALGGVFGAGGGGAWTPFSGAQLYAFVATRWEANEGRARGHDGAGGLRIGMATQRFLPLVTSVQGEVLGGLIGARTDQARLDAQLQWNFGVDQGLRLGYRIERQRSAALDSRDQAFELRLLHYF